MRREVWARCRGSPASGSNSATICMPRRSIARWRTGQVLPGQAFAGRRRRRPGSRAAHLRPEGVPTPAIASCSITSSGMGFDRVRALIVPHHRWACRSALSVGPEGECALIDRYLDRRASFQVRPTRRRRRSSTRTAGRSLALDIYDAQSPRPCAGVVGQRRVQRGAVQKASWRARFGEADPTPIKANRRCSTSFAATSSRKQQPRRATPDTHRGLSRKTVAWSKIMLHDEARPDGAGPRRRKAREGRARHAWAKGHERDHRPPGRDAGWSARDGVSIAHEIELECPFENMGAQVVREVSKQTNEVAGDGTNDGHRARGRDGATGACLPGRWGEPGRARARPGGSRHRGDRRPASAAPRPVSGLRGRRGPWLIIAANDEATGGLVAEATRACRPAPGSCQRGVRQPPSQTIAGSGRRHGLRPRLPVPSHGHRHREDAGGARQSR